MAQSEIGFPFLFHEVPYVRACLALAEAGAFGELRLSGWCRAVPADVEAAVAVQAGGQGLRHYNLSISTSDQMIAHKFRGRLDRAAIIDKMTASVAVAVAIGDPVDLSWARRFGLWAAYAFGQPLPASWPGVGRNAFAHESGIHADGALKDRGNYELYDDSTLGPFPSDWYARDGRVVLTGEYGGKAGFGHVLSGLGVSVADGEEDLVFSLVQLCASATGKPLTDDELQLIAGYPGSWRCCSRACLCRRGCCARNRSGFRGASGRERAAGVQDPGQVPEPDAGFVAAATTRWRCSGRLWC